MKKSQITIKSLFIYSLSIILIASCATTETEITVEEDIKEELKADPYLGRYGEKIDSQPFEIDFQINENYLLEVNVDIIEGSFIVSHYAGDEFSGRFLISLEENNHLSLDGSPTETPAPVEEIYFWADNKEVKKIERRCRFYRKINHQFGRRF